MGKIRGFGYEGKALTCLWCGRKLKEEPMVVYVRGYSELDVLAKTTIGNEVMWRESTRKIARVIPYLMSSRYSTDEDKPKRDRKARENEIPEYYKVYFDPPSYDAFYSNKPMFDTKNCAMHFGLRLAELGSRLQRSKSGGE